MLIILGKYCTFFYGRNIRVRHQSPIDQEITEVKAVVIGKLQNFCTEFRKFADLYVEVVLEIKAG